MHLRRLLPILSALVLAAPAFGQSNLGGAQNVPPPRQAAPTPAPAQRSEARPPVVKPPAKPQATQRNAQGQQRPAGQQQRPAGQPQAGQGNIDRLAGQQATVEVDDFARIGAAKPDVGWFDMHGDAVAVTVIERRRECRFDRWVGKLADAAQSFVDLSAFDP